MSKRKKTQLSKDLGKSKGKEQYDNYAKNFLSYACIQAWLLKGFVKEFAGYSVQEVFSILSGRKVKGKMLDGNAKIKMDKTENLVIGQQDIHLDACFHVTMPNGKRIHVHNEMQKAPQAKEWLRKRGWYYIAREVSSQSLTEFEKNCYEKIEKVYSIWIVGGPRKKNKIEHRTLRGIGGDMDVVELIIVYLGDPDEKGLSKVRRLLAVIFSASMSIEKKKKILRDEFCIAMNDEMKEVIEGMCNLSESFFESGEQAGYLKGLRKGEKRGKKQGLKEGVAITQKKNAIALFHNGVSMDIISASLGVSRKTIEMWTAEV